MFTIVNFWNVKFAVEMPSVLLLAAVRNVPIVCLLCQLNFTMLPSHVFQDFFSLFFRDIYNKINCLVQKDSDYM